MALVLTNKYNTPITQELLDLYDEEIQEQFLCFVNEVPYIKNLISPNRKKVKDLPKDEQGRVIVDLENPHILEDMDYFRPSAIHFEKYGCYTKLRPNGNPKSEYGKWIREEYRRCFEGYVRESDGEWIPGDYYFFLNYCPILLTEDNGNNSKSGRRKIGFPRVWDGHYLMFHYLNRARGNGKHGFILASRSKGKSLSVASMLGKRFVLGEFMDVMKRVTSYITAADKSKLIGGDQTLNKFQAIIDHLAQNTEFPRKRLLSSLNDMTWTMGYKDLDTGTQKGSLNTVVGVSSADNASKLRGTRGVLYVLEEAGSFQNLKKLYANLRPSVEEGQRAFGQIVGIGTAGDQESDFAGMQEIMYHPIGYRVQEVKNVYDRIGYGKEYFSYFFPGYMNYDGCYDENGNSDVVKALLIILQDRFQVKYNTSDVNAITKRIAEIPIVPQEAILRYGSNMFPITQINERIAQIDSNPAFYDDVYVGDLVLTKSGNVEFQISDKQPIRDFPLSMEENQRTEGALEIYEMPIKINGKIPEGRYIIGLDNYENDAAKSMSLGSMFVLDLFTDRIVAEYTGRPAFADDLNEKCRLLCLFYNARCLYEAHPYSQIVHTPQGDKYWKDINIGDQLFAPNGKTVEVIDIPVDRYMPIYKVTLQDGRTIMCNNGHIWNVKTHSNKGSKIVNITTQDIINAGVKNKFGQSNFFIKNGGAVNYEHKDVPIDPYTFGLLLAEGTFCGFKEAKSHNRRRNTIKFSSSKGDLEFYKTIIPYQIKECGDYLTNTLYIDNIDCILKQLGVLNTDSYTKSIPDIYLYNDYNTRINLLKGLMDGDGCATKVGASVYITASEQLSIDIQSLCRSLGINCSCTKNTSKYLNKQNQYSAHFRISVYTDECIFKLPRKIKKQHIYSPQSKGSKANTYINYTAIKSIEFSHYEMGKCVTVDAEDGLYLVGDYVVTHNCNKRNTYAYFSRMNSLSLLADTPEYLRQKQLIKYSNWGNSSKGVQATMPIKAFGLGLIRDWLLKPVVTEVTNDEGVTVQITLPNLYYIKSRALLRELASFNPDLNVDRIMALLQVMLYREEKMILYQGDMGRLNEEVEDKDYLGNDEFFTTNYDKRFSGKITMRILQQN